MRIHSFSMMRAPVVHREPADIIKAKHYMNSNKNYQLFKKGEMQKQNIIEANLLQNIKNMWPISLFIFIMYTQEFAVYLSNRINV